MLKSQLRFAICHSHIPKCRGHILEGALGRGNGAHLTRLMYTNQSAHGLDMVSGVGHLH